MSTITQSLPRLKAIFHRDFSGGVNVADAQSKLSENEAIDSWNVSYDQRGAVSSRLGYAKVNSTAFGAGVVQNVHYSTTLAALVTQAGASLYLGTTNTIRKTFTTAARVGFADFAGVCCVIHPVDGIWTTTDGITWTVNADPDSPTGNVLYPWQNKLFTAGNTTNPARVSWSDAGSATAWTAASFNDLREKDNEQVVALKGASGIDISGRPGLLAFKRRATYRIYDSATGAYQTVDPEIGAASGLSVITVAGKTYALSERGLWWTDGVGRMQTATTRLDPLWNPAQVNFTQLALFCVGRHRGRVYLSLPRAGSTANDLMLEYDPDAGWMAPGSNAASCYASFALDTEKLYSGSPTVSGQVYEQMSGGTDDSVAISTRFQTKWIEPDGYLTELWRLRLRGRGVVNVTVRIDYSQGGGVAESIDLNDQTGAQYDAGVFYDTGVMYVEPTVENTRDVPIMQTCRVFSILVAASVSTVVNDPAIFQIGAGPARGEWSLSGFEALYVPLAIA